MAKKIANTIIAIELEKYEEIIIQYQSYLVQNDIRLMDEDKKRHDEISAQIKIMDSLPKWLAALEQLRYKDQEEKKELEVRGGSEMSGLMEQKMKKNHIDI